MDTPLDPYRYVSWQPRDTSISPPAKVGMLDFIIGFELSDLTKRLSDPSPAIPTLHRRMRDKTVSSFGDRWQMIESHGMRLRDRPPIITPAPREPDEEITKEWAVRIWGSLELNAELRPVMGFCGRNNLTIADVHSLVYLMLAEHDYIWQLYRHPKEEGASPLDWQSSDMMSNGDYIWEFQGLNVVTFRDPPPYWDVLLGAPKAEPKPDPMAEMDAGQVPDPEQTPVREEGNEAAATFISSDMRHWFTPRALIKLRDQDCCRLCRLPVIRKHPVLAAHYKVAHIFPRNAVDHVHAIRHLLDPDAYISSRYLLPAKATEVRSQHEDFLRNRGLSFASDHPTNLFFACGLCEKSFDALRMAVNVFTSPPRMLAAFSPPSDSSDEAIASFDRICTPGKAVNLVEGPFEERFPTIEPSEALFAMHLVVFLARHCRVARPAPQPVRSAGASTVAPSGWDLLTQSEVPAAEGSEVVDAGRGAEDGGEGRGTAHRNLMMQGDDSVDASFENSQQACITLVDSGSPHSKRFHGGIRRTSQPTCPKVGLDVIKKTIDKDYGRISRWITAVSEASSDDTESAI